MRSITMSRVLLSGGLALGALGAIGAFAPCVATAEAAPDVSPFAGNWSGTFSVADPNDAEFTLVGPFNWTITDAGRITGTFSGTGSFAVEGTFVGHVREDGNLMVVMIKEAGGGVPHAGAAVIDDDGNLVASATDTFSPHAHTWSLVATLESD